jgi:hypothetical protein
MFNIYSVLNIIQRTTTVNIANSRIAAKCRLLFEMSHRYLLTTKFGVFLATTSFMPTIQKLVSSSLVVIIVNSEFINISLALSPLPYELSLWLCRL